jgi:hypothetical protein
MEVLKHIMLLALAMVNAEHCLALVHGEMR